MSQERNWLLVKRGLYERSDHMGYTGIRDHAGRYTEEEAKDSVRDGSYGVSMVRLEDAPEFTDACFDDLARKHLRDIIAELEERVSSLQSTIDSLEKDRPHWARGYTSDGVAAQVMMVALNGLWDLLGASNQTEAMGKLRELVGGERIAA